MSQNSSLLPYQILEVANCHGGDIHYLHELIDSFATITGRVGMKFQPFRYDGIATPDFHAYSIYQELFFTEQQWKTIIQQASATKEIWLDLFDDYGAEILRQNWNEVRGIKLQASVLFNVALLHKLGQMDLTSKDLIINVAAFSLEQIREVKERVARMLSPKSLYLEIGFQAFPTALEDSGYSKIKVLQNEFAEPLVFADHLQGDSEDAVWAPVLAALSGMDIIEKHIMHETRASRYDHFSSMKPSRYRQYLEILERYCKAFDQPFVNEREMRYLQNSILVPILASDKERGSGIHLLRDFDYRRSGKKGLNARDIQERLNQKYILAESAAKGEVLTARSFKKASIGVLIACRLKSTRLPRKALLNIGNLTSIELCMKNVSRFENMHHVVLATSTLEEDAPLIDYTFSPNVIFHQGSPEDVIQRYLDVTRKLRIDVIIRATGDCPFLDNEVCQILLDSHFASGADYTTARDAAVGTNMEVINVQALERVKAHFPNANYSEYMTWYFQNNPEHFVLNMVDLPSALVRDYRLTLDYPEDLDLFNKIDAHFTEQGNSEYTLRDIYTFLDANPEVARINQSVSIRYKTDQSLIDTLNKATKIIQ